MPSAPRLLLILGVSLPLLAGGCALRATTDFGPGDEPHQRSVGTGLGPFPNLLNSNGRRDSGDDSAAPGSGDAAASGAGR